MDEQTESVGHQKPRIRSLDNLSACVATSSVLVSIPIRGWLDLTSHQTYRERNNSYRAGKIVYYNIIALIQNARDVQLEDVSLGHL